MSTTIDWTDIAVRLGLTLLAGALIGANRWELGKAAGLRTTTLVGLAACVAMIQVNLLRPMAGRSSNSFVMNDLMRLPLGVLTGVGFIGGRHPAAGRHGGGRHHRGDIVVDHDHQVVPGRRTPGLRRFRLAGCCRHVRLGRIGRRHSGLMRPPAA
jgi:hypothetical protein